jgi:DNA-binding CsgD family transcriptional regulator/hemerythrin
MKLGSTGHAEIDEQHSILEDLIETLSQFCINDTKQGDTVCSSCRKRGPERCFYELSIFLDELVEFVSGHASYEEKLMELLPQTDECKEHVKNHKASHTLVLNNLLRLSKNTDCDKPAILLLKALSAISEWVAHHTPIFDTFLVKQLDSSIPQGGFDSELVSMLDKHAFPQRPRKLIHKVGLTSRLHKTKNCALTNYRTLSPTQSKVFWLVASGKTSVQISTELNVSMNTVKSHRTAIFQKMYVSSVHELRDRADMLRT